MPDRVTPAPRLEQDLASLITLFALPHPPTRFLRPTTVKIAIYRFVDASGAGFGSSFSLPDKCLLFQHGVWGRDADHTSSNYKELRNLVDALEEGLRMTELRSSEVFVFTDNTTSESAFYRGHFDSKLLFDLVLRLRQIEMTGTLRLHVIHVAGTRMIQQGTDGLSRGDTTEGVMQGSPMLSFIPLHLNSIQRSASVLSWVQTWCPVEDISPLSPEDWYEQGHGIQGGVRASCGLWHASKLPALWYLWSPAPAAAPSAIEELQVSRHKWTGLNHIFICPRLMTQYWRRKLHRLADIVIEIPAGARPFWPLSMHEPLILGLTLCFSSVFPWQLRYSDSILELERELRSVWFCPLQDERIILRKLCELPRLLETM